VLNDLHYAVVVGINHYPAFGPLRFARADAEAFSEWLRSPAGGALPSENVRTVTVTELEEKTFAASSDARPTLRDVDDALEWVIDRIRERITARPSDRDGIRIYLYVSGHGVAPSSGEAALLMANATSGRLGEYLDLSRYEEWIRRCGYTGELVIFADCCRQIIAGVPPGNLPPFRVCDRPMGSTLKIVGYAADLGEFAQEPPPTSENDKTRGYFTRALLDGLERARNPRPYGPVTSGSLAPYVREHVAEMTRTLAWQQKAEIVGHLDPPMVFRPPIVATELQQEPRCAVTIRFPAGFAGRVVLRRNDLSVAGDWEMSRGAWRVVLPEGLYVVQPDGASSGTAFIADGRIRAIGRDVDIQL
jgi:hypothetical protein